MALPSPTSLKVRKLWEFRVKRVSKRCQKECRECQVSTPSGYSMIFDDFDVMNNFE